MQTSSTNLLGFNPRAIPWQWRVLKDLRQNFDYKKYGHAEVLLSGTYGSAKSIFMAHLAVTHCMDNPGARVCLARKAMPDLKDTIYKEVIEHIEDDLERNRHYEMQRNIGYIRFINGSEIMSRSWADKKYKKGRSLKLSMVVFEELTENNEEDKEAFDTLRDRLERIPHVKENILIAATNPDSDRHWVYDYFFNSDLPNRFVYQSSLDENPFLPETYKTNLRNSLSPREAERYLEGKWVDLITDRVYSEYDEKLHFKKEAYELDPRFPIDLMFDFNIGLGKPMSMAWGQYKYDHFHVAGECIVHGARTLNIMDELNDKGLFDKRFRYQVFGDWAGSHNDTRGTRSDYDIIIGYMKKLGLNVSLRVPGHNPPVRSRHNIVNSYLKNADGKVRVTLYNTKTLAKGLRLVELKKGSGYLEDDTKEYQHVTTAFGYWVCYAGQRKAEGPQMIGRK